MQNSESQDRAQPVNARYFIGKMVDVQIDRPLGSRHPDHGFTYPVNYGFIQGVKGRDAEDLDAYVLGVEVPVKRYTGICIAVIQRQNDADDKLVVVPDGEQLTDEQIRSFTKFQEQYFLSTITRTGIAKL